MLSPVTAIRAGRPRPRYVQSQPLTSQPRLGLPRRPTLAAATSAVTQHPRAAIRRAARSLVRAPHTRPYGSGPTLVLRRSTGVSWTRHIVDALRVAREGSAAAWRA